VIEITAVSGLATVQDGGRPGRMHQGVPPGGALVPELLAAANAAARNPPSEAAFEVFGSITLASDEPVLVADDSGAARWLRRGITWTPSRGRARVRYVAVRGGIDVPRILGGEGTLLVAGLGGHEGRPLRRGDLLRSGVAPTRDRSRVLRLDPALAIRVVPGPDLDRFEGDVLDVLRAQSFFVSPRSDRVGVRLRGPAIVRRGDDAAASRPMVRGAIQVPPSGELIVLGPDHPTTGGYPVLGTVVSADVGPLLARAVGAEVRFQVDRDASPIGRISP
jgi:biotin-dependent carboxylase-like uncharacterized protein